MRFLADEDFPRLLVEQLRGRGHDVRWVREDDPSASDAAVLHRAQEEGRIVATFDKDFGELAFRRGLPAACGVLHLRIPAADPETMAARALAAIESREDWRGCFAVFGSDSVRVRELPPSD